MGTRSRDLDVFSWGDPDEVRLADCGGGLQFAVIGAIEARVLMERELKRMQSRPSHRSSIATLKRIARANLYSHSARVRDDVIGLVPLPTTACVIRCAA